MRILENQQHGLTLEISIEFKSNLITIIRKGMPYLIISIVYMV